jgi:DNA-binding NtrC family response regulator
MAMALEGGFDLCLFDLKLPVHSGLDLLQAMKERWPSVPVILLTAYGSVETAVAAMKAGAFDFLSKPVDPDLLLVLSRRALEADRAMRVVQALHDDLSRSPAFQGMVGESEAFRACQREAGRLAPTDSTVLLLGETGSGKELFARAVHAMSPRKSQPFVAVNCAAIPAGLLENELFGHEKGAYTGAHESKMGRFELAHRGTLFLDEIGEMHADLQAKLLRVLEDHTFYRVGGTHLVKADVRLVCATNRNLEEAVEGGLFRRDLYYRLSALPVRIPSLRERPGDVRLLAAHYLAHFVRELGRPGLSITGEALAYLESQPWPGNVRELVNRIERAAILADGPIGPDLLQSGARQAPAGAPEVLLGHPSDPEGWLAAEERWRAAEVLRRCGGDARRAARILGIKGELFQRLLR